MKYKISNFWYDIRERMLLLALVIGVLGGCIALLLPVFYYECKTKASVMDVGYEWRIVGGCFLEIDEGVFIHEDNYRYAEF